MNLYHTNEAPSCPLCDFKLSQAHPELVTWFKSVKIAHPDCHISWSYRNEQDQEQAFSDHKTKLHYPMSAHNKTDENGEPRAEALDLFQIDGDNHATFNPRFYFGLSQENHGAIRLVWGGVWKTLGDADHFQIQKEES